jgi:predicted TIM-barrel fold metal-dependent hydrolase
MQPSHDGSRVPAPLRVGTGRRTLRRRRGERRQQGLPEEAFMAVTRIDCDIHPAVGGTRTTLLPYLSDHWKEQVVSRAIDGLDLTSYPPSMPLTGRADWRPANGAKPGSDLAMVQKGAFDQLGASHAILNVLYGAQAVFDAYMAADFCKAINDWIAAEWLSRDPRLRASIVVPMQAPDLAIEEIERRAGDNRFVSILVLAQGETLLGRRHFWPVYQLAEKHRLPLAIHAGTQYRQAPSSAGWPSHRYEYYFVEAQAFQAQILSLIYEGVFGKYPDLKVVLMESGVSWLPAFMWRANKTWRGVRVEVPWVEREPASIIRDNFRVTMQPFDAPGDAGSVEAIIDQIGSEKMFLFASDYPHWQFDGDDPIPPHLPKSIIEKMCVDNPLETFPRLSLDA